MLSVFAFQYLLEHLLVAVRLDSVDQLLPEEVVHDLGDVDFGRIVLHLLLHQLYEVLAVLGPLVKVILTPSFHVDVRGLQNRLHGVLRDQTTCLIMIAGLQKSLNDCRIRGHRLSWAIEPRLLVLSGSFFACLTK